MIGCRKRFVMKTYELIDHTADVGIKAYGKTISEAFENAAKAMFDIITDNSEIESIGQYDIELKSDNDEIIIDFEKIKKANLAY